MKERGQGVALLLSAACAVVLLAGAGRADAAFPGGVGKIVFNSNRDGNYEIYVMNANGSGQTRLTFNPATDNSPVWSPDGTQIAFQSDRSGVIEIYVMNADGSGQTQLTDIAQNFRPAWSPDGTQIAFQSDRDGKDQIYVMNANGSGQTRLTFDTADDFGPDWSPDGTKIAFSSDRSGSDAIWVMSANGLGQTQLTTTPFFHSGDQSPDWSPDGKKIAFYSDRDSVFGDSEIYVINANGSGQTRLTNNSVYDLDPAWSPDGNKIAFDRGSSSIDNVYVMDAGGSGQTQLTTSSAGDFDPDWQPVHADVAVSLAHGTFNPATRRLTWTITVSDAGPQPAAGVVLSDAMSATTFVSAASSEGSCTGPAVGSTGTVMCSLGTVSPGTSQTAQVVVHVPATTATFSDQATVSAGSPDPSPTNNSDSATVSLPTADLALAVAATPNPVGPNQQLTYSMTVTNKGPNAAGGTVLNNDLPGQVGFISVSGVSATACAPVPAVGSTGLVSCSLGPLASGASVTVRVVVNSGASKSTTLSDTANTRSLTTDPIPANNSGTVSTQVSTVGTFRLTPTMTAARPGSTVHLHITWIAPRRWRDLRTVELGLLDGRRLVGLVRFRNDGSKTGRLSLGAGSGKPGAQRMLSSGGLSLLLARSRVHGSGPTGKTVTIDLALRVGPRLAGDTLTLKLGATDRHGTRQPFRRAGSLTVRR